MRNRLIVKAVRMFRKTRIAILKKLMFSVISLFTLAGSSHISS
jgi:hypothetical protein